MSIVNIPVNLFHRLRKEWNYFFVSPGIPLLRRKIDVRGNRETLDYILSARCSVSRYGDGEFQMILRYLGDTTCMGGNRFQDYNPELARKLYEIVSESQPEINHIVCIPLWFHTGLHDYKPLVRRYCRDYMLLNLRRIFPILNPGRKYFNANISRFYMSFVDKAHCGPHVAKLKEIWNGRDICIVEGEKSRLGVGNDLFLNARSITRILCPPTNAFDKYDEILNGISVNVSHDNLLILALGHTATVLAYDLARLDYQAIDLGHIDIEYEWMKMHAEEKTLIKNKYVNEVDGGDIVTDCDDADYLNQIILRIG